MKVFQEETDEYSGNIIYVPVLYAGKVQLESRVGRSIVGNLS